MLRKRATKELIREFGKCLATFLESYFFFLSFFPPTKIGRSTLNAFAFTFDLSSNHLHACWRTITMKLQTISFRRGKGGGRGAMKMGLKTTRLISFLRRVVVISTPHALPQRACSRARSADVHLHDRPLSSYSYFSTRKRPCLCIRYVPMYTWCTHTRAKDRREENIY